MASTDTYPLVDRLIEGGLPAFLASARERGDSFETIAFTLRSEHGIPASAQTVRRWWARAEAVAS